MVRIFLLLLCSVAAALAHAGERSIVILGDSLSAGYGVEGGQGWVALLEQRLRSEAPSYQVVNASISGDTTKGGLARLPDVLRRHKPAIVVVELGGNDGLRGLSLDAMAENLAAIVEHSRASGARVLLVAVRLPPNYGPVYVQRFQAVYEQVAARTGVTLVPQMLAGIAERRELMQDDGIHPRANAQAGILDNIWPHLQSLLTAAASAKEGRP